MGDKNKIVSSIDIGSNAIRMVVAEVDTSDPFYITKKRPKILKKWREPIRLGEDVFASGVISSKNVELALEAFKNFSKYNKEFLVEECRAVATSAVREASNKNNFLQKILTDSGIKIHMIDGIEEAQLIHLAVSRELDLRNRKALLIDIGGGSVEITFSQNELMISTASFLMGTVRTLDLLKKRNLKEANLNVIIGEYVDKVRHHLSSAEDLGGFDFAIGTGGNLDCLAKLKAKILKDSNNDFVTIEELSLIINKIKQTTIEERVNQFKLREDRADVILPALLLTQMILRQAQISRIYIPKVGLKEGILWSNVLHAN